jgi:hypothetical protein
MGEIIFLFCRVYLVVDYREPRREILFFTGDGVSYRFSGQFKRRNFYRVREFSQKFIRERCCWDRVTCIGESCRRNVVGESWSVEFLRVRPMVRPYRSSKFSKLINMYSCICIIGVLSVARGPYRVATLPEISTSCVHTYLD